MSRNVNIAAYIHNNSVAQRRGCGYIAWSGNGRQTGGWGRQMLWLDDDKKR